jgi:hypothetical protein
MTKKTLYMGTTSISPAQTAGEIISELVRCGANSINTDYVNGNISGIRWIMQISGTPVLFEMPIRVEPVLKKMGGRDREQAERTAWRQLLRWVQAQNALIKVGMAQAGEIYLAYMVNPGTNQTLFQHMLETRFRALPAPTQQ